jgi:HK97 gp10 family phage protein
VGWTVRYNHFGAIGKAMPRHIEDGVDGCASEMSIQFKGTLWEDTGMIRRVTTDKPEGKLHAEVWIGYSHGRGFYSRFQEWGTIYQRARPIVGPTAHRFEPQFALEMAQEIREACEAK